MLSATAYTLAAAPQNPGTLQLSSSAVTVSEKTIRFTLTVTRTGGSDGPVSIAYATSDGTATAATLDYVPMSGTLSWAAGDTAPKTIVLYVLPDSVAEPNETFFLTLSNPSGGATLGATAATKVTITDGP